MRFALLHPVLKQRITRVSRIAFDEGEHSGEAHGLLVLSDALVLSLFDGSRFELIVDHGGAIFVDLGAAKDLTVGIDHLAINTEPDLGLTDVTIHDTGVIETQEVWTGDHQVRLVVASTLDLLPGQARNAIVVDVQDDEMGLPCTIESISECWGLDLAGDRFFAAAILWGQGDIPLLCIYRMTDEILVLSIDKLHERLDDMALYIDSYLYRRYDR